MTPRCEQSRLREPFFDAAVTTMRARKQKEDVSPSYLEIDTGVRVNEPIAAVITYVGQGGQWRAQRRPPRCGRFHARRGLAERCGWDLEAKAVD